MYTSYLPTDDSRNRKRKGVSIKGKISAKTALALSAALVLVLGILVSVPRSAYAEQQNNSNSEPGACNCVIFRLDDVQDYWLSNVQVAVMEKFIDEHEKLNLGVITNYIGEDDAVVNEVKGGIESGNFEIVNHSQNHDSYIDMSAEEQHNDLVGANGNINSLFGVSSVGAFIPPYHEYNEDTLAALQDLDMKVISAQFNLELPQIYNPGNPDSPNNKIYKAFAGSDIKDEFGVYHLPQTIGFYDHGTSPHTEADVQDIMDSIDASIERYGYAVVTLHPTDFAVKVGEDEVATNEVSDSDMANLDDLLEQIHQSDYTTKTFSQVITSNWNGEDDDGSDNNASNNGNDEGNNDRMIKLVTQMIDKAKKLADEGIPSDDQIPDNLIMYRMYDLARWGGPEFSAALYITDLVPSLDWSHMTEKQQIYYMEKMMGYI